MIKLIFFNLKRLIIIPFYLLSIVSSGTKYYIKGTGNDANTGLSDAQAWRHHPWMSTWTGKVVPMPGDSLCLKRGDSWSIATPSAAFMTVSQSGSYNNPITTTWYGASGNKPFIQITGDFDYPVIQGLGTSFIILDHLEISHCTSARKISGQSGIVFSKDYSKSNITPHDWVITNCDIHNIPMIGIQGYDDSYNIIIGDTSATSCATSITHSNNIYDCGYAGIALDGRNPITNLSNWHVYYNYIHDIDYTGGVLRDAYGIAFSSGEIGLGRGYSTGWPNYCVAKYNCIENVPGHTGIDTHGGTYIYFQNNYIYNCKDGITAQAADRVGSQTAVLNNAFIEGNIIENPFINDLGYRCFIYMVGVNVLYRPTNCYIRNNILGYKSRPSNETDAIGIYIENVNEIDIEGNKVYNGPLGTSRGGICLGLWDLRKIRNIKVSKNFVDNWDCGIHICTGAIDGSLAFYDNIIYSQGRPFVGENGALSDTFKIYNNTVLTSSTSTDQCGIDFSGDVTIPSNSSLIINNNIVGFTSSASNGRYILTPEVINGSMNIDNNLYWNSKRVNPFYLQSVNYAWADWKAHGYDVHSFNNTDPLFQNYSGSFSQDLDFEIQKFSPAVNAGIDVGLKSDYSGNPISGLPDIGAFEITGNLSSPAQVYINSTSYEEQSVQIYPNPAHKFINIRIDEPALAPDFIRIINLSGKIVFKDTISPGIKDFQILINLIKGIYILQLGLGNVTQATLKLVVCN
jgi:hypothetical protein